MEFHSIVIEKRLGGTIYSCPDPARPLPKFLVTLIPLGCILLAPDQQAHLE